MNLFSLALFYLVLVGESVDVKVYFVGENIISGILLCSTISEYFRQRSC